MSRPRRVLARIEITILAEDLETLDQIVESEQTTRGVIIRRAIYATYPAMLARQQARVERLYEVDGEIGRVDCRLRLQTNCTIQPVKEESRSDP